MATWAPPMTGQTLLEQEPGRFSEALHRYWGTNRSALAKKKHC